MSRSIRKNPFRSIYNGAKSEKSDKKIWHSRLRRMEQTMLHAILSDKEDYINPGKRDASNICGMIKEGKNYFSVREMIRIRHDFGQYSGNDTRREIHEFFRKLMRK